MNDADMGYASHCPGCRKAVRPSPAVAADFPGTIRAVRKDGTCLTCWRKDNPSGATGTANERTRRKRAEVSDERAADARQTLDDYLARRRARGIPEEGTVPA